MTLEKERKFIGIFAKSSDAELALQELQSVNFSMHKVSVIARNNVEEQCDIPGIGVKEDTGNASDECTSGALGGLASLLVSINLLAIPDMGLVMLAGAEATAIATTITGGAIGVAAGSLAGALLCLGIPEEQAHAYSDLVFKGYYLVIVTGIEIEIRFAKRIFNRHNIQHCGVYQPYLSPKSRYKYGVGVFSRRQDTETALTQLKKAGFPMSQVSVITKGNYNALEVPDDLAKYYEEQLNLGNFIVLLNATDIYMAGARAILESNKIQNFRIYSELEAIAR
ncbi:hypothetical protein IQ276_025575 [Desmonostoc muscorum LEGE 12446]|uniref:General stress protein 17M-like domain-containing protein n=1 Tax=Desmonostoc muscorum LEGE 12446 TaxID=1828758 RepID=A0A8J7AC86_DESMC|nr:hypothetical protein [Desmonostoc muscorum]MCF2149739.1 hypothetical protein [Desmonostoc muscorum LEGE 12446]